MLRAIMINGFGWFRDADFRRAWLLFDGVDYIFPVALAPEVTYSPLLWPRPEFDIVQSELRSDQYRSTEQWLQTDLKDPDFCRIAGEVPRADVFYARRVVLADLELRDLLTPIDPNNSAAPLSILTSKLLLQAKDRDAIPIVGKTYAWSLLASKLAHNEGGPSMARSTRRVNTAAIAAGLSLSELDDDVLGRIEFSKLQKFKQRQSTLLEAHQLYLAQTALKYTGLPVGAEMEYALEGLQLEARRERAQLDHQWSRAWADAGFDILNKGIIAGAAGAIPALALMRDASAPELLHAAMAPALSAGAVVANEVLDLFKTVQRNKHCAMAYLFEAKRLLERG